MKRIAIVVAASALLVAGADVSSRLRYPKAPQGAQADDYHGTKIADPYRVLESADDPATQQWVEQENALTFGYLAKLPGRAAIKEQLTGLWNYEKFTELQKVGDNYFYFLNTGLQNQPVVYVTRAVDQPGRVLLDPNTFRADGTAALSGSAPSWDGQLFAYGESQSGSDWADWHVRDVATGKDLPDLIRWTKAGTVAWSADGKGFYYTRYEEPPAAKLLTAMAEHNQVYFHKLGDAQAPDRLIYERREQPKWIFGPQTTRDGRYLLIAVGGIEPGKNLLFYQDLGQAEPETVELFSKMEYRYEPIETAGTVLYLLTTDGATRGRVIAVELKHPERSDWKEIVPEHPETLESASMADGKLVLTYLKDAHAMARVVTLDGKAAGEVEFPGIGTANWSPIWKGDRELFFRFTGFVTPPATYCFDLETGKTKLVRQSNLKFDAAQYETKQVFYTSKDGTRVPMFLSYKKGLKLDGRNPTLLNGYGGFTIAITPAFRPAYATWMSMGGVLAVANLRGGSEYGEAWHQAGTKKRKQNVFDDFIGAAEWLIANKYTSTPKLAIYGASNGGLLIGAVLNQRPELFGAAMPDVGVMDMLRFHKFGFGAYWMGDYGSPDNAEDLPVLLAYSPLHNIRKGTAYPPTLVTTSDHDDRVMPGHSLKYAATLQQAQEGPAPILLRVETRAGHGAGKPTSKQIDEWADRFTFLKSALKMDTNQ